MARALVRLALLGSCVLALGSGALLAPAQAKGGVSVDNGGSGAVIDSRYSSNITVSGRGFQSIKGGHGGIYVWFGTVSSGWQPSKGGKSGVDYLYVPDGEAKQNAGFQRFVAFPGSDTASAANGGTMTSSGDWSVRLVVPGPKFEAVGRNGSVRTVDCTKVTCGVITVGAHGVANANNETFTPVSVRDLSGSKDSDSDDSGTESGPDDSGTDTSADPSSEPTAEPTVAPTGTATQSSTAKGKQRKVRASIAVDRSSAVAGRALSFVATGLAPGEQFTVILDDGAVASGPHAAGTDGRAAGVISLPAEVSGGTHELRVYGASRTPSVKFAIAADPDLVAATDTSTTELPAMEPKDDEVAVNLFVVAAGVLFVIALVIALSRVVRGRRAGV